MKHLSEIKKNLVTSGKIESPSRACNDKPLYRGTVSKSIYVFELAYSHFTIILCHLHPLPFTVSGRPLPHTDEIDTSQETQRNAVDEKSASC